MELKRGWNLWSGDQVPQAGLWKGLAQSLTDPRAKCSSSCNLNFPHAGRRKWGQGHSACTSARCLNPLSGGCALSERPRSGNHRKPSSYHGNAGSSQACMAPSSSLQLYENLLIIPCDHSGLGEGGLEQRVSLFFDEHTS